MNNLERSAAFNSANSFSTESRSSSVEELRRKAQEHSAALLHSLQQHAMEFHLQHQHQQQQLRKKDAVDNSQDNSN